MTVPVMSPSEYRMINHENPFVKRFNRRPDPSPFGYHLNLNINKAIDNASMSDTDEPLIIKGRKKIIKSVKNPMVIIDARALTTIQKIQAAVVVVISPTNLTINNLQCSHFIVVGGYSIIVQNCHTKTFTIYGTNYFNITNGIIDDTLVAICDIMELGGEYYLARSTYMACMEFKTNGVRTLQDKFYMLGMGGTDINQLSPSIVDPYPNMFIGTLDFPHFVHGFKVHPLTIHKRLNWLIYAMYNVNRLSISNEELNMWDNKNINDAPIYARVAQFMQNNNRYYKYFFPLSQMEIEENQESQVLSTCKKGITALDLIPSCFCMENGTCKPFLNIKL